MKYLKLKKTSPEEEERKKKKENERRNKSRLEREATNKNDCHCVQISSPYAGILLGLLIG